MMRTTNSVIKVMDALLLCSAGNKNCQICRYRKRDDCVGSIAKDAWKCLRHLVKGNICYVSDGWQSRRIEEMPMDRPVLGRTEAGEIFYLEKPEMMTRAILNSIRYWWEVPTFYGDEADVDPSTDNPIWPHDEKTEDSGAPLDTDNEEEDDE